MNHRQAPELPAWPQYDDTERDALLRALDQGQWWRHSGTEVESFEREFAAYTGAASALAVTNCTHALELALQCADVGPGTEVIVPAFTYISAAFAAQRLGAAAVPVDVDPTTYCIDVRAAASAITPRTRAIVPVHTAGLTADMDALAELSTATGIAVIQDAAHAVGACWQGRKLGELGSPATFSFGNIKLMTGGEGGAIIFPESGMYDTAFLRHNTGRARNDRRYHYELSGTNMRLNEFSGAVLRAQLRRLDAQIEVREKRWDLLARLLGDIDHVLPQGDDARADRNPRCMAMFRIPGLSAERRDALVDRLVAAGLPVTAGFSALYRAAAFAEFARPGDTATQAAARCPNTENISSDCLMLHHRVLLAPEPDVQAVADIIAAEVAAL
jgi:3-amino-5-hydroxybenzoate synthase